MQDYPDTRDHLACDQCRIKKIRCGKERPNCSNCNRMNLDCNWSGQGKKPNQTVVLNKSISTMGERLRLIEGNISGIQRSLQRLDLTIASRLGLNNEDVHAFSGVGSSPPRSTSNQGSSTISSSSSSVVSDMSSFGYHIVHDAQGHERCVGPSSLLSLIHSIDDLSMPEAEGAGANAATAREKIRELGYNTSQPLFSNVSDGSAIKEPPMLIVEALIEPYFDSINSHFPIFTREGFCRLMNTSRAESNPAFNRPFAICANNMVLLTLSAKALHSRSKSTSTSNIDRVTESIDVELIQSFISNANRAMVQVEQLLSPRLVNVQALLSLCFVAQMWLCEDVFNLALTLAAHVAKSMGLCQPQALSTSRLSHEEVQERRNVLQCLYYLDRAVCWNSGSLSNTSGDVVMMIEAMKRPDEPPSLMDAKFALAQIEDDLYTSFYSKNTLLCEQISMKTRAIQARLQDWRAVCNLDEQDGGNGVAQVPCSRLELDISFHYARMRLMWPFVREAEARSLLLSDCRASLLLLRQLWDATSKHDHYPSFAWLIVSFPTSVIFQFASQFEDSHSSTDDLELLNFLSTSLQNVSMFATENSYVIRFNSFVRILVRLAHDIIDGKTAGSSPEPVITNMFELHTNTAVTVKETAVGQSPSDIQGSGLQTAPIQDSLHLHEDLDSLMTMWDNGTSTFAGFPRENDIMVLNDFSPTADKGIWEHFNLANNLRVDQMQDKQLV
ncbi:C6 transcription factor [Colletotrichum truncatum]|uniref:C6 transcription factor n=1 Tax=Colletotrichum truncatum TaxID=5467 RepID=A0ACC3ZF57_COLTU|nr:C6 transcription factor [Colletotrichum truncatum]KAF6801645.1 C6 transcription factor [Colletotrichum truncatum]